MIKFLNLFKKCTAPNITYCRLAIKKINACEECKYFSYSEKKREYWNVFYKLLEWLEFKIINNKK